MHGRRDDELGRSHSLGLKSPDVSSQSIILMLYAISVSKIRGGSRRIIGIVYLSSPGIFIGNWTVSSHLNQVKHYFPRKFSVQANAEEMLIIML